MIRSMQGRLLAGTLVSTAGVLSVAGIAIYVLVRASLWAEFDGAMADKARTMTAMVEQDEDDIELEFKEPVMSEFDRTERLEHYQIWRSSDQVLLRSPSLQTGDLPYWTGPLDTLVYREAILPNGRPGRLVSLTYRPQPGHEDERPQRTAVSPNAPITLIIGRETTALDRTLSRLRTLLVTVGVLAAALSAAVLRWTVYRGLSPLRALAGQIEEIDEQDLGVRLDVPRSMTELMPVVFRLNGLLERLDAAFARERAFTADAAHELRTPLAGLLSILEVTITRTRDIAAYQKAIGKCLSIARQMRTMVDNLLWLARLEAAPAPVERHAVCVEELLLECWGPLAVRASERQLHVTWQCRESTVLSTDRDKLRHVFVNVLENAVTYTNTGGQVTIESLSQNGAVLVRITNTGSELSQEEAEQAFARFWRGDSARKDTGQHYGLGLSLSQRIVALLGGSIQAESQAGGVFTIQLTLPDN